MLMIDGFDGDCQVPSLCSQDFYNRASEALKRKGVLVVNLLSRDRGLQDYLRRIENSFAGRVLTLAAEAHGNLIVFAFKHSPGKLDWENLRSVQGNSEQNLPCHFPEYVKKIRRASFSEIMLIRF